MRRAIFFVFCFAVFGFSLFAQWPVSQWSLILGTPTGLVALDQGGSSTVLWQGGAVSKIITVNAGTTAQTGSYQYIILSTEGILVSSDLRNWEHRDQGLPKNTIKVYENNTTSFISEFQEIKDLEIDPRNPEIMVCAVKDAVYLTRNGGRNWENLGMPNYRSNGTKAVAVTSIDNELVIFFGHSIYGLYYYTHGRTGARWEEISAGLELHETTANPDEIADIAIRIKADNTPEIIVSQTFRRRIYRLDWQQKKFDLLWSGPPGFGSIDSLSVSANTLRFIQDEEVLELTIPERGLAQASSVRRRGDLVDLVKTIPANLDLHPLCAAFPERQAQANRAPVFSILNELWLILDNSKNEIRTGANLEGLYLPVNHAMDPYSLAPYLTTIRNRNLNMVTIDMKDDYGRLRFTPRNTALTQWGRVFRPVDIEAFLKTMKDANVYTVARIVVFKDPEAAVRQGGRFAIWDNRFNIPWEGYYDTRQAFGTPMDESSAYRLEILPGNDPQSQILRTYYDERWVDPYAEEYWEYIAAVSEELCERGFDEIQYDYIRFPTDGVNLADASYRWRNTGMSMDSAIISFLRHVRQRVKAPISVDIYGANGWYRTGARTGQEVELLAPWVDIICPMYYPSHFEQDFLAQNPPEMRPYRIYYQGTLRTRTIARNKVIVRPWVQAFYLNVSYDRQYYDVDYVRREIEGARDAGRGGFTYWNNSGRYDDIPMP